MYTCRPRENKGGGERNNEWENNRDEREQMYKRERPPLGESSPCAHNTVIVYKVPFVQVPPGGGGWGSSLRRRQLELREDEAVSGAGKHTRRACQSSSDKGSYWDESSTEEEEEDVGADDVAGAAEASDDEGPPDATLLPTGLLGATAMERTDSAENGYAYVVGKGCGGGGGADE